MKVNNAIRALRDENTKLPIKDIKNVAVRNLLDKLPPEIKDKYQLTKAQVKKLEIQLRSMRHGALSKSVLICKGDECPMKHDCILHEQNMAPVGNPCPYELVFIEMMQEQLVQELKIGENNTMELLQLADFIMAELMDMRAMNEIAKSGIVTDQPAAVDPRTGETIYRQEESPAFKISEALKRRKDRIRQQFLATRESQAKYLNKKPDTPDSASADLLEKFEVVIDEGSKNE